MKKEMRREGEVPHYLKPTASSRAKEVTQKKEEKKSKKTSKKAGKKTGKK